MCAYLRIHFSPFVMADSDIASHGNDGEGVLVVSVVNVPACGFPP
jgi:hypothetical protein